MPESTRKRYTRKNLSIDAALHRAIEGLYELYYEYLREHPDIAVDLEDLMYDIADCRTKLRRFHIRCWETDPPQMRDSRNIELLIREAKRDCLERVALCLDYSNEPEVGPSESLRMLLRQGEALLKQLESSDQQCQKSLSQKPRAIGVGSHAQREP